MLCFVVKSVAFNLVPEEDGVGDECCVLAVRVDEDEEAVVAVRL